MASRYLSAPQQNFTRLSIISVDLIRLVLEDILRSQIEPADLENAINSCSYLGDNLRPEQKALCCLPSPDYSKFDVSLLYTLIRNLCPVFKPTKKWGKPPSNSQVRIGDDIERLRVFRNEVYGHCKSSSVSDTDFKSLWTEVKNILLRVQKFMTSNGNNVDYTKELAEIADKDVGCEDMRNFRVLLEAMIRLENEANVPKIVLRGAQSVICGENASFEVEVESSSASAPWSVTWQKLRGSITQQIDISREKYRGSNYERLVIQKVSKEDEGEYQAVLSRGASRQGLKRTSNSIFLEAAGDLPVLHILEVSTGLEEITIHYKYEVRGNSPTVNHIAWTKNGDRIRIDNMKYIGGDLKDTCLTITSPAQDDIGQYTCAIGNAVGEVSESLSLDVPCATIFTEKTVYFGDETKINSVTTACPHLEEASWEMSSDSMTFETIDMDNHRYFGSNKDLNNPILIFPKANFDDKLYYRLVIRNIIGQHVSNIVYLNVTGDPPNISNSHVTNIERRSVTLTCEIFLYENGPPLQEILWMKDGTDIDIARSGGKYSGGSISNPSLVILDVSQFDKGSYQCKGSNAVGSTFGKVIVLGPATPQNDVQIFTAIVRSIPAPSKAHWLVKPEGQNEWISININSDEYRGTTNSLPQPVLVVKSKNRIENQSFKIEVTNFIGTYTRLISVKRKMSIDGTEEDQQGSVTKGPRIDIEDDIQTELKANETVRLDQKEKEKELDEREKEKELDKRKIELLPEWGRHVLGEYSTWKTPISDQFSSLSDDEVWVLFCFLCSDSGTPDFTDTDCLDILNKIREWMYDNERVTSEKAQRTLDRLKSLGFIWNQDGVDITEDAKDETVYRVTEHVTKLVIECVTGRRISGRLPVYLLYQFSSYTTAVRYLRSHRYTRKSGEKCVMSDYLFCDPLLIQRLQMNILTHVTMEDTDICDKVSQYLNIPLSKVRMSDDKRRAFIEELQQTGECMQYRGGSQDSVQHVKWLWRYDINARPDIVRSCIGLLPHWDIYIINNTAYRKHSQHHDRPPAERCLLYSLLMVEDYTVKVKDESHIKMYNVIRERCFTELPVCEEISAANDHGRIIHVENNVIKFKSDDIRHDVMYTFVTECLVEDSDLKFFLTTASCHVISEYCRLWDYKRSEGERCLYIPEEPDEMYDLFIDGIQLDILTHSAMSDRGIHGRITKRLNVPEEVMKWGIDARRRYVKSSKEQGRKKLYCARGMLVGCAGAGKTTLLKKLQNRETSDKDRPTETTVGLEVHEDLFEIESGTLKNYKGNSSVFHSDKQLISMTDFAGQVAYYACHQVYLSRRAFYMLVVDMSKNLTEKVHEHNKDRHDPIGSLFHNWTYDDYIVFWLQCIQTYCDVGKRRISGRETERENSVPVILIASHKDETDSRNPASDFFWKLKNSLKKGRALSDLLSSDRYFEVECPPRSLNDEENKAVENVKQCIVKTVQQMPQWGEEIPLNWIKFAGIINKKKKNGDRILKRDVLRKMEELGFSTEEDMDDMLRFFQEIGHIIYFADEKLKDTIIINVQWFVDGFKHIITDQKHVPSDTLVCDEWMKTGRIPELAFHKIWEDSKDDSYVEHQDDILPYMHKLGLMTQKLRDSETKEDMYYVPSMNRMDLLPEFVDVIKRGNKTSVLIFHFKTYLPHFFFFRLVVNCLRKWEPLRQIMFCKNAAFYQTDDDTHCVVIAVNNTSILLQVFTLDKVSSLQITKVVEIRDEVEKCVAEITKTFHEQVRYDMGYSCMDVAIDSVDDELFLLEQRVLKFEKTRTCPNHILAEAPHFVNKHDLIGFWRSAIET